MIYRGLVLFASLSLLAACSQQPTAAIQTHESNTGIVGGDDVSPSSNVGRSTVAVYDAKVGAICTGTLVAPTLVLTAAHCVRSDISKLIVVFAPKIKGVNKELVRKAIGAVPHPLYAEETPFRDAHDIALVRFAGSAPEGYQTVPLLADYSLIRKGGQIRVAGYGLNWTWGLQLGAGKLRTTVLQVDDPNFSATEFTLNQSIRRGVCSGDSGGPAYIEGRDGSLLVAGVVSRGDALPTPLIPKCFILSVFTRVDAYAPWIAQTAVELLTLPGPQE
jgi:secreted trypsin-like serine protease